MLPAPANETIGRGGELAEISELLVHTDVRLVTLVGPGGVGKTRLALEAARAVADRFPGGAVHVNLDGVEDAGVLVPAPHPRWELWPRRLPSSGSRSATPRATHRRCWCSTASNGSSTTPGRSASSSPR